MKKASLIISFYNRIDQLKLILAALEKQTIKNFEVIISDDGSKDEIVKQIQQIQKESTLSIIHTWHPDKGFNKTKILNKSVLRATGNHLIFIDGDCVPSLSFIEDHLKYAKANRVIVGRRVELSSKVSSQVSIQYIKSFRFHFLWLKALLDSFVGETRKAEAGLRIGNRYINEELGSTKKGILGCNFSIPKSILMALNGFDERYIYPGVGEDTELRERVKHARIEIFKPKFALVQFHLWHKRQSRSGEKENLVLLEETIQNKYVRTPYGIYKE